MNLPKFTKMNFLLILWELLLRFFLFGFQFRMYFINCSPDPIMNSEFHLQSLQSVRTNLALCPKQSDWLIGLKKARKIEIRNSL